MRTQTKVILFSIGVVAGFFVRVWWDSEPQPIARTVTEYEGSWHEPDRTHAHRTSSGAGIPVVNEIDKLAHVGDARAQWKLADRMRECSGLLALDAKGVHSQEAEKCKTDGVPTGDWQALQEKAIAAKDPVALLLNSYQLEDSAKFEEAAEIAARSNDPEAQILLGHLLLVQGDDPVDAIAWMIVGCGDCTMDDPRLGIPCAESGACASGIRFVDYLAAQYGHEITLEAQARANSLKEMYR